MHAVRVFILIQTYYKIVVFRELLYFFKDDGTGRISSSVRTVRSGPPQGSVQSIPRLSYTRCIRAKVRVQGHAKVQVKVRPKYKITKVNVKVNARIMSVVF